MKPIRNSISEGAKAATNANCLSNHQFPQKWIASDLASESAV